LEHRPVNVLTAGTFKVQPRKMPGLSSVSCRRRSDDKRQSLPSNGQCWSTWWTVRETRGWCSTPITEPSLPVRALSKSCPG